MIPVNGAFTAPDPSVDPRTFGQTVQQLNALWTGSISTDISTFIMGVDVPSVDNQIYPWFRINTIGAPVGWYAFRLGVWTREEPPVSARFGFFTGSPGDFFDATGKGLKGVGPIAGDYWGWALMNGKNGTANLSNRFIILGAMDNVGITGFDSNWRTNVNGVPEATGGVAKITLDADNTYSPDLVIGVHDATGESLDNAGKLYGKLGDGSADLTIVTGNTSPDEISVVPPFFAMALIQFIGYVD